MWRRWMFRPPASIATTRFSLNVKGPQMATASRKRRLSQEARRALELLIDQRGTTEALMLAHGFTGRMLRRLIRANLITIRYEAIEAGANTIEVGKVRITYSGRRALEV